MDVTKGRNLGEMITPTPEAGLGPEEKKKEKPSIW